MGKKSLSPFFAILLAPTLFAQSPEAIRKTVTRALPLLQKSTATFVEKRACVSCHHNIAGMLALQAARQKGFAVDQPTLSALEEKTFHDLSNLDEAVQGNSLSDTSTNSQILFAALAAGQPRDLATAAQALRILTWQRQGHWVISDFRPPHSFSQITATAWALYVIRFDLPPEMQGRVNQAATEARAWLLAQHPNNTEEASFRLLGLRWAAAASEQIATARQDLLALQKPNGGWAQTPRYQSDAYSTGEAIYALQTVDAAWQKGARFLISTQATDGTWHVHTRMISPAEVSPRYFATGFPYGKDEFLSYAGSAWAVAGLLGGADKSPDPMQLPDSLQLSWQRTALFGSVQALTARLDAGLDPNSTTPGGTSLMMLAATDPEKVRLLLARGANPDALIVAASYGGTSASLRLLLDAGGEAKKGRHTPLGFAAKVGDLDNIKLLLARGEKPTGPVLADAVTFGYADVVQALIQAGASTSMVESSGINLMHWATLTDRPTVIPVLAAAGVPLNAQDENGYTPLMYAATIDFGDTAVLDALLKAGADPKVRDYDKRSPLDQAHRHGHRELEERLRSQR